jgi:hypothetical protein
MYGIAGPQVDMGRQVADGSLNVSEHAIRNWQQDPGAALDVIPESSA